MAEEQLPEFASDAIKAHEKRAAGLMKEFVIETNRGASEAITNPIRGKRITHERAAACITKEWIVGKVTKTKG